MLAREDLPFLIVIADCEFVNDTQRWLQNLRDLAHATRGNKLIAIQVRIKNVSRSKYLALAKKALTSLGPDTRAVLNGHADDARDLGYWGLHVSGAPSNRHVPTCHDLPWFSMSVHSEDQLKAALDSGATAVLCSPVFQPSWKDADPIGVRGLRELAQSSVVPTYALGGIIPSHCQTLARTGAAGVAVLSGIMGASNPIEAVNEYLRCRFSFALAP